MMAEMPLDVALGFLPSSLPASRHPADCPPLLAVLDEAACKAARLRAVHKTDLLPAVLLKRGVRQILDSESGGIGHLMLDAVHVGGRTLTQRQEYNARASSTQSRPNSHVIQEPARFIHAQGDGIAAFTVSPNAQTSAWQALQKVTRGEEKPLVQKVYGRPTRIYTYTCFFAHPDDVVSGDISIDRLHSVCSHRRGNPAAPATCGCVPKEGGYEVQDTLFTQVNGVFELHSIVEYTVVIYKDAGGSNRGAAAAAAVAAAAVTPAAAHAAPSTPAAGKKRKMRSAVDESSSDDGSSAPPPVKSPKNDFKQSPSPPSPSVVSPPPSPIVSERGSSPVRRSPVLVFPADNVPASPVSSSSVTLPLSPGRLELPSPVPMQILSGGGIGGLGSDDGHKWHTMPQFNAQLTPHELAALPATRHEDKTSAVAHTVLASPIPSPAQNQPSSSPALSAFFWHGQQPPLLSSLLTVPYLRASFGVSQPYMSFDTEIAGSRPFNGGEAQGSGPQQHHHHYQSPLEFDDAPSAALSIAGVASPMMDEQRDDDETAFYATASLAEASAMPLESPFAG